MAKHRQNQKPTLCTLTRRMKNAMMLTMKKRLENTFSWSTGARMEPTTAARMAMTMAKPRARTIRSIVICCLVSLRYPKRGGLDEQVFF